MKVAPVVKKVAPVVKKVAPAVKKVAPVVKKVAPVVKKLKVAPVVKKVAPVVKKVAPVVKESFLASRPGLFWRAGQNRPINSIWLTRYGTIEPLLKAIHFEMALTKCKTILRTWPCGVTARQDDGHGQQRLLGHHPGRSG